MDSVVSPATAIRIGELGGLGVLNLEGLWTRYDDPQPLLDEIVGLPAEAATRRLQEIYAAPIKEELIAHRLKEVRDAGVVTAAALSPQRTAQFSKAVVVLDNDWVALLAITPETFSGRVGAMRHLDTASA